MPFLLVLDILVATLLVVTIGYAAVLNRRLRALRRGKGELEDLAVTFSNSTQRAEESIGRLRETAQSLQGKLETAQSLRDDLAFLVERGAAVADRLENAVRAARKQGAAFQPQQVAEKPMIDAVGVEGEEEASPPRSEAERELLKALESAR